MKRIAIDSDLLHYLYIDCQLSTSSIGEMLGCSKRSVLRYMYKYDIESRSISVAGRGEKHSGFGKHRSIETKQKISISYRGENNPMFGKMCAEQNPNWRGGITKENAHIRQSPEMKEWRLQVFGRDCYTCQDRGVRGTYLNVHHILTFAKYPVFRFTIANGITLCENCHNKTKGHEEELEEHFFSILF